MSEFIDTINIIGAIGTVLISTATLFTTRALQRSQQKVTIMATKRSERIDYMRDYSAGIISCVKHIIYDLANDDTKRELVCYIAKFNSLLQYAYTHDVEIIDNTNRILEISLCENVDKKKLEEELLEFWKKCDVYVGVEHERLKNESMGNINGSGKINCEHQTFESIYRVLSEKQDEFLAPK